MKQRINLSIDEQVISLVTTLAKDERRSVSNMIEVMLVQAMTGDREYAMATYDRETDRRLSNAK